MSQQKLTLATASETPATRAQIERNMHARQSERSERRLHHRHDKSKRERRDRGFRTATERR